MQAYGNTREDLNNWDFPSDAELLSNLCCVPCSEGGLEAPWSSWSPNQDPTGPPTSPLSTQPPSFTRSNQEQNQAHHEETGPWSVQLPHQTDPSPPSTLANPLWPTFPLGQPSPPTASESAIDSHAQFPLQTEPFPPSTIANSPWPTFPAGQPSPPTASESTIDPQLLSYLWSSDRSFFDTSAMVGTGDLLGMPTSYTHSAPPNQDFSSLSLCGVGSIELDPSAPAQGVTCSIPYELTAAPGYLQEQLTSAWVPTLPCAFPPWTPPPEISPNNAIQIAGHLGYPGYPVPLAPPDLFLAADGRFTQPAPRISFQIRYDRHCDPWVILGGGYSPPTAMIGSAGSSPATFVHQSPSPSASPFSSISELGSPMDFQSANAHSGPLSTAKNPGCRCGKEFKDEKQHWRSCRSNPDRRESQCPRCLKTFPGKNHLGNLRRHLEDVHGETQG
ncbi:hypothetical protein M407DRAFT_33112 [Tulasnella calospora MUT 4182]|uniref:Uncharacterized protein n=1 Tax=Tulasnella calospora MUT 4182 TaxID=1051891 RepID=A0A0C3Q3L7_9AGAM|nr:hypothetical protein M407DRAFT_33112 [Tulasnella calospora MUT 4182]